MTYRIAVKRLSDAPARTGKENTAFRRDAYAFLLSEICSSYGYVQTRMRKDEGENDSGTFPPFEKDSLGKPYLPEYPEILFNLSHSRNGYAAAVVTDISRAFSVGIDIERRFPFRDALAGRICHEDEYELLSAARSEAERQSLLNLFWSRKEAVLKCEGTGIRSPLKKLNTTHIDETRYEITERQTEEYTLVACCRKVPENPASHYNPD